MSTTAFIAAEFNPFHKGHKYLIDEIKRNFDVDTLIAGMSGAFVQRGEPAIFDKHTRAAAAIKGGCDLVVQLPYVYCAQTAEMFALGAVSTAQHCGAKMIFFGAEDVLPPKFYTAARLIESGELKELIEKEEENVPFAQARIKALNRVTGDDYSFLTKPNNILALEYIKAIIHIGAELEPVILKRREDMVPSSTIRKMLSEDKLSEAFGCVPAECYKISSSGFEGLKKVFGGQRHSIDDYIEAMKAFIVLKNATSLENVADMPSGFSNRFKNKAHFLDEGIVPFLKATNTKTVPDSRIRRCLINMLMSYSKGDMEFFKNEYPTYIRLLGANAKGCAHLKALKDEEARIITKLSDFISSQDSFDEADMKSIMIDMKAEDLFYLRQNRLSYDLKYTPYIDKAQ